MTGLETLIGSLGLSFASGINLYATVLVIGLAQRYGWFPFLPEQLSGLGDPLVLWSAGILYALEFFADKIPFVATVWDGFHTFIRPLGAALLSLGLADDLGPAGQILAFLIGGSIALGSHSTKAGARAMALTAPEPVTHSVISVAEDVGVIGLTALVFTYPWVGFGVACVLIALMAVVTPTLYRTLRFILRSFFGGLGAAFGFEPSTGLTNHPWSEKKLQALRPGSQWERYRAFVRKAPGLPRFGRGILAIDSAGAVFIRKGWFGVKLVELSQPSTWAFDEGVISDGIELETASGAYARLLLTKDWAKIFHARAGRAEPPPGELAGAGARSGLY